jgi:hypothetical protein
MLFEVAAEGASEAAGFLRVGRHVFYVGRFTTLGEPRDEALE